MWIPITETVSATGGVVWTPTAACGCNYTWGPHGQPLLRPCLPHMRERCTCPTVWHGVVPPPACPIHGQLTMPVVVC